MVLWQYFKVLWKAIYLPAFMTGLAQNSLSVLLPLYVLSLGHSPGSAALIFGCREIGGLLGSVPSGKFIGRYGDKQAMLLGAVLLTLAYGVTGLTANLWVLGGCGLVLGIAAPLNQIGRQSYLTERYPPDERGRIISLMGGVMRIGTFIGPLVGGFVAAAYGYSLVFLALACTTMIAGAFIWFFVDHCSSTHAQANSGGANTWQLLVEHRKILYTAGFCMIAIRLIRAARHLLLPLIGAEMGLGVEVIGTIVSAGYFIDALMFGPAGHVMDKYGRKHVLIPTYLIFATGLTALTFVETHTQLLLVSLYLGVGNGLSSGILFILGSDYAPEANRSRFLGLWRLISDIGAAGGPMVIGAIINAGSLLLSGIATGSVSLIGALVMLFFVREPLKKRTTPDTAEASD